MRVTAKHITHIPQLALPGMNLTTPIPLANSYALQPATWRDLNALRHLEKVCFPKDAWPLFDLIGVLTFPDVVRIKAIHGEELVGFISGDIHRSEATGWISTLAVLPEHRRRGLGAALLQACEARLDAPLIRLCVRMTNREALQLYQNAGYHPASVWPRYYEDGEDALVLEKALPYPARV